MGWGTQEACECQHVSVSEVRDGDGAGYGIVWDGGCGVGQGVGWGGVVWVVVHCSWFPA